MICGCVEHVYLPGSAMLDGSSQMELPDAEMLIDLLLVSARLHNWYPECGSWGHKFVFTLRFKWCFCWTQKPNCVCFCHRCSTHLRHAIADKQVNISVGFVRLTTVPAKEAA